VVGGWCAGVVVVAAAAVEDVAAVADVAGGREVGDMSKDRESLGETGPSCYVVTTMERSQ